MLTHTLLTHTAQLREEELPELDDMARSVPYPVKGLGGNDNKAGKANVLMQVGGD